MDERQTIRKKYLILSVIPAYFISVGFLLQPFPDILKGFLAIIKEPDFLITDYFVVGGVGAAFLNAGLVTLLILALLYHLKMEPDGHTITSCCLIFGFSLFGKNVVNIWTILLGVFLYAHYHGSSLKTYIYVGLYGTSLSPIITQLMQIGHLPLLPRILLSVLVGIAIGFVLPPLSSHVYYVHKGYSLYNVGFACGIIATVVVSLFYSFGITIESRLIWDSGHNTTFGVLLGVMFAGMILLAFLLDHETVWGKYLQILKCPGVAGTDYLEEFQMAPVLLNMGINGAFATAFVLCVGGDLNGPTIGGIFTILGFSATGKHIRNIAPVMFGVLIGGLIKDWSICDPAPLLALLFSTTLAPIAGKYGIVMGLIAGFLHSSVALNVGILYSGFNLYNNGFAGGLVAVIMVPLIQSILDKRERAKEDISI